MKDTIYLFAILIISISWNTYHNDKSDDLKRSHLNELKQRDSVEVYLNTQLFVRDSLIYNSDAFFTRDKDCKNLKQYYFKNR
jgi:hypothetical protein